MKHIHPISDSEYRNSVGVSQSILKGFARCPAYVRFMETEAKRAPTPSQVLGLLTEHRLFGSDFKWIQSPFDSFRTTESKTWRELQALEGKQVITASQMDDADQMIESLHGNKTVQKLIKSGRASMALYGTDPATGLMRKGFIDFTPDSRFILDLKTSADPSPFGFGRSVAEYRYDIQDAYYTDLFRDVFNEDRVFVFVVVQNCEPYLTATYTLRDAQRNAASDQYKRWLARYAECDAENAWPGYTDDVTFLDVPRWIGQPVDSL